MSNAFGGYEMQKKTGSIYQFPRESAMNLRYASLPGAFRQVSKEVMVDSHGWELRATVGPLSSLEKIRSARVLRSPALEE